MAESNALNLANRLLAAAIMGLLLFVVADIALVGVEREDGDCVYAGQVYSNGAVMQQGDRMMECSNGTWVETQAND